MFFEKKKKKPEKQLFCQSDSFLTVSASHHLPGIKKCLIMLFPVLGLASVHFIQIKQQLAEVTCTVLYLNKCFLI